MQPIFQNCSSVVQAIKALIDEKKDIKIVFQKDKFTFSVVDNLTKEEKEKSAKDFFLFIRKKATHLEIETLSMGERLALIDAITVLELFIESFLSNLSYVKEILEDEIFCLKLGYLIPRNYLEKETDDIKFIRNNDLDKILFYHGVSLSYHPQKGVSIPFIGKGGIKHEVYFSELKQYNTIDTNKYYYNGEFLFETDHNNVLLENPRIQNQAIVTSNEFMPFIFYNSGYLDPSFEIYYRKEDFFIAIHDGDGSIYRFGFEKKKIISPDIYVYGEDAEFKRIFFPTSKENSNLCIDMFIKEEINTKKAMIEKVMHLLDIDKEFYQPLTCKNKLFSYMYIPKLFIKALRGEISFLDLLTPWKTKQIDFNKIEKIRGNISSKSSL